MKLVSPEFSHQASIPKKYTCDGEDVSPPLSIGAVPAEAKSLALIVDDPDSPGGVFDHWIVWNISPETTDIGQGMPARPTIPDLGGALQGENDFGELGYRGPCPPGGEHRYRFTLYALKTELDLDSGASKSEVEKAMEGQIIEEATLVGLYSR